MTPPPEDDVLEILVVKAPTQSECIACRFDLSRLAAMIRDSRVVLCLIHAGTFNADLMGMNFAIESLPDEPEGPSPN